MEMVTRYAGEAHITAEGWGDLNRGIVGTKSYALPMGRAFEADLVSNNLLKIYDGCGVMQGREVRIPAGQSEEVTIENGTQGEKRIDLVVERYSKNEDTKIESSETILIKGTPSETDPQVPDHIEGDIRAGDMTADWPLYEVELDGINVVAVRPVFGILMNMADLKEAISDLSSNKVSGFGDIETVSNPYTPDVDGLIRIYFSPSGNTNATVYATQNGISHFSATSSGGANIAQFFPALAGHTYQGQASQPGTIQLAFMPLRTG